MSSDDNSNKILSLKTNTASSVSKPSSSDKSSKVRQNFVHGKSKVVEVQIMKSRRKFPIKEEKGTSDHIQSFSDLTQDEIEARLQAVNRLKSLDEKDDRDDNINNNAVEVDEISDVIISQENTSDDSIPNEVGDLLSDIKYDSIDLLIDKTDKVDKKHVSKLSSHKKVKSDVEEDHARKKHKGKPSAKSDIKVIFDIDDDDDIEDSVDLYEEDITQIKKPTKKSKIPAKSNSEIFLSSSGISIGDLANRLSAKVEDIEKMVEDLGEDASCKKISIEVADTIIKEYGRISVSTDPEELLKENVKRTIAKPPVVVVMGHVDHGKTSLLDKMRNANVAKNEKGGITQHVAAYRVKNEKDNRMITFIDTPGHAVFKDIRARGSQITDIVILVVAADDGVKAQTIEAIRHAQSANVPIIVAINKMDKEGVDSDKIRGELSEYDVLVEKYGGDVIDVEISAKTGMGIDALQEAIFLQMDMMNAKTYEDGRAVGVVLESKIDKGSGCMATVIVIDGILNKRDVFICGSSTGRVRCMLSSETNQEIVSASPSQPIIITGFTVNPHVGEKIIVCRNEKEARIIAKHRKESEFAQLVEKPSPFSFFANQHNKIKELNFVVKADAAGSLNAIIFALEDMSTEDVKISIIHSDIGDVSENDMSVAYIGHASIIAFNVKVHSVKSGNQYSSVQIKHYNIVYNLIDEINELIKTNTDQKYDEIFLGSADVIKVFDMKDDDGNKYRVAGCIVKKGAISKMHKLKIIRNDKEIVSMKDIKSLQIRRIDADEVPAKEECGIVINKCNSVQVGDIIQCFKLEPIN